jgi:hypothetical protein
LRIFLDANVLFSAAQSDGAIRRLLGLLLEAGHECWADGFVLAEARRNLTLKSPSGLPVLDALLPNIRIGVQRAGAALEASLPLPDKDRPVLGAAIAQGCQALLTGDRSHFGRLYGRTIQGVTIHSPRSLAESVLG